MARRSVRGRWIGLGLVLLLGLALRLGPWGEHRFLEDEALYSYWGQQVATGADPMLDHEPVDKPPLHPYLLALSFRLLGRSEAAARLPSLLASLASVGLVYALGTRLPGGTVRAGLLAALWLALSPFDLLFASTAFTDPLLVTWVLAALLAATSGRLALAGLLAGLAVATKQPGLLFLPLVVALGSLPSGRATIRREQTGLRRWAGFAATFGLAVGGTFVWDAFRVQRPGYWAQGIINYGGLHLAPPDTWPARLGEWLGWLRYFGGSTWANGLGLALLGASLPAPAGTAQVGRRQRTDVVLAGFGALFIAFHTVWQVQVWDRYLLGLAPLAALLVARGVERVSARLPERAGDWAGWGLAALLVASLTGPALTAARGGYPVGGDHGAYDGVDQVAGFVRARAEEEARTTVVYHHWLGYHYHFYLYGAPVRTHWWPDPADLAADALQYQREARWIAFPSWVDAGPARAVLTAAGMRQSLALETRRSDGSVSFRLYRIEGP